MAMFRPHFVCAAIFALLGVARSHEDELLDDTVLLQASTAPASGARVAYQRTGMHLAFVTDCGSHQRWLAALLLHSAGKVGQDDPITWLRFGCKAVPDGPARDLEERLLRQLYLGARVMYVNSEADRSVLEKDMSWIKALAFEEFLKSPEIQGEDVVAMLDADFVFMSKFRIDDLAEHSIVSGQERPSPDTRVVQGFDGIAQRYLCCLGIGAPYALTAMAWREVVPAYAAARHAARGRWGEEQEALAKAIRGAGVYMRPFDHLMISDITAPGEGWDWAKRSLGTDAGKACQARVSHEADSARLPTFLHIVRPWSPQTDGEAWLFSKYQVPPGWQKGEGEGILHCDMPLLAEPPADIVQRANGSKEQLKAWTLCGIIHGVNDMLTDFKRAKCPGVRNEARALKLEADWKNVLLPGATLGAESDESVHSCAVHFQCT